MKVVLLGYYYDRDLDDARALLDRYRTLTGWAGALASEGAGVTVVHRFRENRSFKHEGVQYHFVADRYGGKPRPWQIPRAVHARVLASQPAVVHLHGLFFALQARALRAALPSGTAILGQHHAEKACQGIRGRVQKFGLKTLDGFLFSSDEIGARWVRQGIIESMETVHAVMEGSTRFLRQDRDSARARTHLKGDPVFLWVGRLNENKDPLTVLSGFEGVLKSASESHLYMIYTTAELLPKIRARLEAKPNLAAHVHLLGARPHSEMADMYNSADYFVLGSHDEGSGYALVEALACGAMPIVTDIPSFRMMTDGGRIGGLWPPGCAEACTETMLSVIRQPLETQADAAHRFFQENLSYPAIGRRAMEIYKKVLEKRGIK
jgi:glycosyltransferase involved in cell wall biosynthesis